jgi:hypothetical protein
MCRYAVDQVDEEYMDSEAQSLIREAERLEKMTRVLLGIDIEVDELKPISLNSRREVEGNDEVDIMDNAEMATVSLDPPKGEERDEEEDYGFDIVVSAAQVQSASRSVVEEARRLQFETERYTMQLMQGALRDASKPAPAQKDRASDSYYYNVIQEALAVAIEAEQLQEIVVRLLADVIEPAVSGKTNDD